MGKGQLSSQFKYLAVIVLMVLSAMGARVLRPERLMADELPPIQLEATIPKAFGEWQMEPEQRAQIVNPQTKQLLESLYSETLSRVYIDQKGRRVMLSVAYGRNQADDKAVHYPEVCYPAQGFQISKPEASSITVAGLTVPLIQMVAKQGARTERVVYWATVGERAVRGPWQHKLAQLKYSFRGVMPDGMIFRVSAINDDVKAADQAGRDFITSLYPALPAGMQPRIYGSKP